jgi:hypothetical protein
MPPVNRSKRPRTKIRALLVCPNPRGTDRLRTDREERVLRESIRLSKFRGSVEIDTLRAATLDDLRRGLRHAQYDIIHFSGHGTRRGLVFEDESGRLVVAKSEALARLVAKHGIETAILNACYSLDVGTITPIGTKYTIAMDGPIADDAAIEFSRGFYDAIGDGDDVPGAFQEGIDCAELKNFSISAILLPDGVRHAGRPVPASQPDTPAADDKRTLLLGIALDVSGSMQESIADRTRASRSRLQSAKDALGRLGGVINRSAQERRRDIEALDDERVRIFACCFGTRIDPGFDDLLGVMLAARQVDVASEVERRKRTYEAEARAQASRYSGLESLATRFLGGGIVASLRNTAERDIRQRITGEIAHLLRQQASTVGSTVLNLKQFSDLFDSSRDASLGDFEALVYGSTPLRATAAEIAARFRSIPAPQGVEEARMLLIISDGEPTDGDPQPHFKTLSDAGVTIVSCYVTNRDVADPRILLASSDPTWETGAKLMFEAASPLDENGQFASYLLRHGWTIEKNARMFVQINHSDVLEEFVSAVGSRLEQQDDLGLLPVGQ